MNVKTFSYIIYLILLFINGFILADVGLTFRNWQYWVIVVSFVAVHLCGYVRGGQ